MTSSPSHCYHYKISHYNIYSNIIEQNIQKIWFVVIIIFVLCWEPAYCILSAYCMLSAALSTASSFRIWNSSTGSLSLPGARVRNSSRGKGHEEGGSAYAKAGSSLRSPPGNSRASTPKIIVCLLYCFVLSPTHLSYYRPSTELFFLTQQKVTDSNNIES